MIVGDLDHGALANFPAGNDITFKFDEMTLATSDLVRVIGREFVGLGVVAPNAFVKVTLCDFCQIVVFYLFFVHS